MANSIEIIISGGFVGIQQNEHTLKVCIPIGYLTASAIQKLSDQDKIDLLFNLQIMIRKIYQKLSSYQKIRFRDDDDSEISQIQLIDQFTELQKIKKLIDHFDSFDLMHLQFWKTQNDQINFDHLHLMFDQGVILKNNAVFWEYQSSEQKRYLYGETALVKLYCFLLKQMITLLGSDFCLFDDLKKDVLSISQYSALFVDEFLNSSDQFY